MEMHHVQEHLIPCVSGMRWDKPPRCSCEERETIRISDKNASALSSRGGYCTLFSMEPDTMKFRIVLNITFIIAAYLPRA